MERSSVAMSSQVIIYHFLFNLRVTCDVKPSEIILKTRDLASFNMVKLHLILNESFIYEDLELDTL